MCAKICFLLISQEKRQQKEGRRMVVTLLQINISKYFEIHSKSVLLQSDKSSGGSVARLSRPALEREGSQGVRKMNWDKACK